MKNTAKTLRKLALHNSWKTSGFIVNMEKYILFLRGVNVGGNAIISMTALKAAMAENQLAGASTYINSGNVIVASEADKTALKEKVREIIQHHFGLSVEMIVKTKVELENIISHNPFDPVGETDNSRKVVMMLSESVAEAKTDVIRADSRIIERFYLFGDLLYAYYPNGAGQSKFTTSYVEKKLNVIATGRNWNTLLKISALTNEAIK